MKLKTKYNNYKNNFFDFFKKRLNKKDLIFYFILFNITVLIPLIFITFYSDLNIEKTQIQSFTSNKYAYIGGNFLETSFWRKSNNIFIIFIYLFDPTSSIILDCRIPTPQEKSDFFLNYDPTVCAPQLVFWLLKSFPEFSFYSKCLLDVIDVYQLYEGFSRDPFTGLVYPNVTLVHLFQAFYLLQNWYSLDPIFYSKFFQNYYFEYFYLASNDTIFNLAKILKYNINIPLAHNCQKLPLVLNHAIPLPYFFEYFYFDFFNHDFNFRSIKGFYYFTSFYFIELQKNFWLHFIFWHICGFWTFYHCFRYYDVFRIWYMSVLNFLVILSVFFFDFFYFFW